MDGATEKESGAGQEEEDFAKETGERNGQENGQEAEDEAEEQAEVEYVEEEVKEVEAKLKPKKKQKTANEKILVGKQKPVVAADGDSKAHLVVAPVPTGQVHEKRLGALDLQADADLLLTVSSLISQKEYINARVRLVDGKRVREAVGTLVPNTKEETVKYKFGDLKYDVQRGFLLVGGKQRPRPCTAPDAASRPKPRLPSKTRDWVEVRSEEQPKSKKPKKPEVPLLQQLDHVQVRAGDEGVEFFSTLDKSEEWLCESCGCADGEESMLICGDGKDHGCDKGFHIYCLNPALPTLPDGDWYCSECEKGGRSALFTTQKWSQNKKRPAKRNPGNLLRSTLLSRNPVPELPDGWEVERRSRASDPT
jgi:hypothetical protein